MLLTASIVIHVALSAVAMDHHYADQHMEGIVKGLSPAITWIYNANTQEVGTGVLLNLGYKSVTKYFVVTNYHTVHSPGDFIIAWYFDQKGKLARHKIFFWAGDKDADIALMEAGTISVNGVEELGAITISTVTGRRSFADGNRPLPDDNVGDTSDIVRGRNIFYLGFPLNLGIRESVAVDIATQSARFTDDTGRQFESAMPVPTQKIPVVRYGHIAYGDNGDWFLADAMNNHGNSGSPIFTIDKCPNEFSCDYIPRFIGIMRSFEKDSIVMPLANGNKLEIPHNSGLAVAVSIGKIKKVFENQMEKLEGKKSKR